MVSACAKVTRALALHLLVGSALVGCGSQNEPSSAEAPSSRPDDDRPTPVAPGPAPSATPLHRATQLDLMALAHLAELERHGLHIEIGAIGDDKYLNGGWRSGWGARASEGSETFRRFGASGRLYFHVDRAESVSLRLRIRSEGAARLLLFLNGSALPEQALVPDGAFHRYEVVVPAELVVAGENYLLLRSTESRTVDGEAVSMAVASVDVAPSSSPGVDEARPPSALGEIDIAGDRRLAYQLAGPSSVRWYLEVPEQGELRLDLASPGGDQARTAARVVLTPDEGPPIELGVVDVDGTWREHRWSLAGAAGSVARVALVVDEGVVGVAGARVEIPASPPPPDVRPARNVIVLVIDTLRASKLQLYDPASRVKTPFLDRFATQATLFERAQSPENWTKPAVASILTSLHPSTHETRYDASRLPVSALMLGEVLQKAGFSTASFIANGYVSKKFGFGRGWDHHTNYIRESRNTNASNVYREAIDWIREHKTERFFVYLQTIDPHVPYDPPDEYLKMYDDRPYDGIVKNRRTHLLLEDAKKKPPKVLFDESDKVRIEALHDGEISYHDHHMGVFLQKLERMGLSEDTLFVITADHGEEFQEHGSWGHGHSVYQELLHVPLLFRWPNAIEAGVRARPVVSTVDIAPTVLDVLAVDVPEAFEGRSLLGHMRGTPPPGPYVAFSDFQENRRVIRGGRWKLIIRGNLTYALFDLERDPHENNPLDGNEHPIALRYLRILSGQYLGATDRGRWLLGGEPRVTHEVERATLDEKTCRELASIGYVVADCKAILGEKM